MENVEKDKWGYATGNLSLPIKVDTEELHPSLYAATTEKKRVYHIGGYSTTAIKKNEEKVEPGAIKDIEKLEMAKSNKLRYEDVANSLKEELLAKEKDMSYKEKSFKKEENKDDDLHIPYPEILQPKEALRYNKGKLRYTLLMPEFINGTIRIMEFGAQKYELDNWRKGMPFLSVLDSLYRHLNAIWAGEDIDAESGEPHWAHASANIMFLCNLYSNKELMKRFDNRLKNHT